VATRRRYTKEQYAAAVPLQEKLIAELEKQRPNCCSHEYLFWQPEITVAEACLRGMKNPFRGRESLDSFSAHGGVNVDLYMDEFYNKGLLPKERESEVSDG
jgi:hypothetical protein